MAIIKCKECKKEVSSSAKVCPHCGVKDPAITGKKIFGGILLVAAVAWGFNHFFSDDKDISEQTKQPTKECSLNDGQCLFDTNLVDAAVSCKPLVEKSAKYDFEWTSGMFGHPFSRFRLDSKKNQLVFIGDKVKFTNGFNAKTTMTYSCAMDLKTKNIVDFHIAEGKL